MENIDVICHNEGNFVVDIFFLQYKCKHPCSKNVYLFMIILVKRE